MCYGCKIIVTVCIVLNQKVFDMSEIDDHLDAYRTQINIEKDMDMEIDMGLNINNQFILVSPSNQKLSENQTYKRVFQTEFSKYKRYLIFAYLQSKMIKEQDQLKLQYPEISTKFLQLKQSQFSNDRKQRFYRDKEKAFKCLRKALELSQTLEGCQKLYKISYYWMQYLFQAIQVGLIGCQGDDLHLRLILSLLKCQKSHDLAFRYQHVIQGYRDYSYSTNFRQKSILIADALKTIQAQKIQKLKKTKVYQKQFKTKEQAQAYLKNQDDWYGFLFNQAIFKHFYSDYVDMLIAAARAGAVEQVINMYPKGCRGCFLYSVVKWSSLMKQKQQGMLLLATIFNCQSSSKKLSRYYSEVLQISSRAARKGGFSMSDPQKTVCLDLRFCQEYESYEKFSQQIGKDFKNLPNSIFGPDDKQSDQRDQFERFKMRFRNKYINGGNSESQDSQEK